MEIIMLLRLATFGALGYAAYNYYTKNKEQVDGTIRRFTQGGGATGTRSAGTAGSAEVAGGPLSGNAEVVHPGEGPLA